MSLLTKIDSNSTGSRYCEEASLGVLPAAVDQVWKPLEPNKYSDFGGDITTVARRPINADRQQKKGTVTDVSAKGGITTDLTQGNLQDLLQGLFYASLRRKIEEVTTSATASTHKYHIASSTLKVGSLINVTGFTNSANNGPKRVTAVNSTDVTVAETLVDETATGAVVEVGFQFAANDAAVFVGGSLPQLTATAKNLTDFGLIPGEWLFIGGDSANTSFTTSGNNGFARVRSVATGAITLDKTSGVTGAEHPASGTIRIYFGRVQKNERGTAIVRRSYTIERTLGANNDADLTKEQAEYLEGAVADKFTLNVPTANKIECDLSFVALRSTTLDENDAGVILLSKDPGASAPDILEASPFNTSSDVSRIRLFVYDDTTTYPDPLFAFVQDLKLTVDNKTVPDKAVGVVGAFEVDKGLFEVGGSITAYFSNVAAIQAVRNNDDVTMDAAFVKENAGFVLDLPLLNLGGGKPTVEIDKPILIPLTNVAVSGVKIDSGLNHTALISWFDYLPDAAE